MESGVYHAEQKALFYVVDRNAPFNHANAQEETFAASAQLAPASG